MYSISYNSINDSPYFSLSLFFNFGDFMFSKTDKANKWNLILYLNRNNGICLSWAILYNN